MKLRNWKFGGLAMGAALILSACGSSGAGDSELLSIVDSGRITPIESTSYDWGDINIEAGKVSHIYKFKNDGDEDLIIKSAVTSCMCTIAEITVGDNVSPEFGMHESKPWGYPVKPGQEFSINVVFDPMAHGPDAVGPIQRSVYLETSSVQNGEYAKSMPDMGGAMVTEIKATGNVLYKSEYESMKSKSVFFYPKQSMTLG